MPKAIFYLLKGDYRVWVKGLHFLKAQGWSGFDPHCTTCRRNHSRPSWDSVSQGPRKLYEAALKVRVDT